MAFTIKAGETTAAKLQVPLLIFSDAAVAAWTGTVTDVKPSLIVNGAAPVTLTNDVVRELDIKHRVQITVGEWAAVPAGAKVFVVLAGASGRGPTVTEIEVPADDVYAASPTDATVASAVWGFATREVTTISASIRQAMADSVLGRAASGGADGGRTVSLALSKLVNRWLRSGTGNTTLTHYAANDTTPLVTETLTLDANGAVIGGDPN